MLIIYVYINIVHYDIKIYLILLGEGTGACSAITGNTEVNLSVGRKRRAVREDNLHISLCL